MKKKEEENKNNANVIENVIFTDINEDSDDEYDFLYNAIEIYQ